MLPFLSRKKLRLGLALSGGGARAFAHAGALEALEHLGLRPDIIAGVSAGAVTAVLYAGGMKPRKILEIFTDKSFKELCSFAVPRDGFFTMDGFKNLIEENVPCARIEDLPLKTVVCATDMDHGRPVAFESGALGERVVASCSIPIIFKPVKIDGVRYLDGGVLHNLPAWAIRERCRRVIGFNCSPIPMREYKDTLLDIAQASYNLAVKSNTQRDAAICDMVVEMPQIADYKVFNLKNIENVFEQGYNITLKAFREIGIKPRK